MSSCAFQYFNPHAAKSALFVIRIASKNDAYKSVLSASKWFSSHLKARTILHYSSKLRKWKLVQNRLYLFIFLAWICYNCTERCFRLAFLKFDSIFRNHNVFRDKRTEPIQLERSRFKARTMKNHALNTLSILILRKFWVGKNSSEGKPFLTRLKGHSFVYVDSLYMRNFCHYCDTTVRFTSLSFLVWSTSTLHAPISSISSMDPRVNQYCNSAVFSMFW